MPPTKFQLNQTYGLGEMSFEEPKEGCYGSLLGYQRLMILAIMILHVTLNLRYLNVWAWHKYLN